MAAEVEVQTGKVGRTVVGGRLHLSPLTDSSNSLIEIPSISQSHIITPDPNKPVPGPKPRLTPKPFVVEKNPTIKPIVAPKPQPKPRPEATRLTGCKPDLPCSPKPQQPVATGKPKPGSANLSRPASTSFKTSGQTTKPVVQPFKPAPSLDPGDLSKPTPPVPAERQRPGASSLTHSKSLKIHPAAEWSGTTKKEGEKDQLTSSKGGATMTRAKSMGFLVEVGKEEEEKEKPKPEAAVPLRPQSRGSRPRPVSAIFLDSPTKTETPVPAPRWAGRRPLSADLTAKFESIGLSLHRRSPKVSIKDNTPDEETLPQKKEPEKTLKSTAPQSTGGVEKPAASDQSNKKTEEVKETDEDKRSVSIRSRISLLLDSPSSPAAAAGHESDLPSPVQPVPESEPAVGVKQLIKQLTEDTTPTQSPVVKPQPRPRPLPLDLTKRFSSERSPDLGIVSLSEAADRHDITSKDSQRRMEESAFSPSDQRTFVDLKDSQEQSSTPERPDAGQSFGAASKEGGPGGDIQTVRASLFENVVERHSVLMVEEGKPAAKATESLSSSSFKRGKREEEGTLVTATFRDPVSPSSPLRVLHSFDTVQAVEEIRAMSENIPSAQWEDKALTLRSRRSEGSRPVPDRTGSAQGPPAPAAMPQQPPRYLRVGALQKWTAAGLEQEATMEKGMLMEPRREEPAALDEDGDGQRETEQDEVAAAPKRLKMLQAEEQTKPRATYFALTGQIQEAFSPVDSGPSVVDFEDFSVRSTLGSSQGKVLPVRRNPSLDQAFGRTSQEQVRDLTMRSHLDIRSAMDGQTAEETMEVEKKRELIKEMERNKAKMKELEREKQRQLEMEKEALLEFERMKEMEMQREFERQRQKAFEEEKQRALERVKQAELEKQKMRELEKERLEREKQRQLDKERRQEMERQRRIERERLREQERQRQREEERQRELDKERQLLEIQKEKQKLEELERIKELERQKLLEFEKQKQKEKERQQLVELEKQRLREKKDRDEAEKTKQMALEQEMLRIREIEKERERQREMERQQEIEREMQKELERQRQRDLERDRQRQLDAERQELEKQRLRQQELEKERRRKEELVKEMERRELLEFERHKQAEKDRQQILELERRRLREKVEREEAEKMRQIAKQQEAERQRLKERQKKEEQERAWFDPSPLRPKVLDLDSVIRNDPFPKATSQRLSDSATRWKEPTVRAEESYKPAILDIDSFTAQAPPSPSKDWLPLSSIQGADAGFGAKLQPAPERDISWKLPQQTPASFTGPVWTASPQDPWELRPVEMSVDQTPEPRKHANKVSPEQLLLRQEGGLLTPQRHSSAVLDELLHLAPVPGTEAKPRASPVSSAAAAEQIWFLREPQPPESRGEVQSQRRSQGSQELNRMRSRSVSRRSAPSGGAVEGSLSRMRSRSAHREQDRRSLVQQKQSDGGEDSGETPVRDTDSQYGTWETGLRSDDSLTPDSTLSPSPRKPSPPHTPGDPASQPDINSVDGVPSSSSSFAFPEAPGALLDTSALRSRAQLGKKRAPRTRPSRAARLSAALADEGSTEDWLYRDSTEAKAGSQVDDSDSEEQVRGVDSGPGVSSQPQRIPVFPGMDPSALKAQLKKRGDSDNQTDGPASSPSQLSRSPKSPFLPRAARVLPPAGGRENGEEDSPQWLKELKTKKRLSQYESES
uniref:plectin n=1 Tax=Scatophagus argus TaxID=75038 RepID=UPI001ED80F61|nr:plectin [Scatophagus argus]XP_046242568.1 plectin [Scatophagus argus]XP_046242570.1 plectin [Scatophagus argus]XP_046242571.1 plectin [Scatophagus argus]XP_046242572.1 plectin [Scatophagus argus]XP_046242573.1 plectin [Scatophagus argus]XP_046242574.1 plectin [Scatophagus argus]